MQSILRKCNQYYLNSFDAPFLLILSTYLAYCRMPSLLTAHQMFSLSKPFWTLITYHHHHGCMLDVGYTTQFYSPQVINFQTKIRMRKNVPPLHVLRGLLRHIKGAPTGPSSKVTHHSHSSKKVFLNHVLSEYRAAQNVSKEESELLQKLAYDILILKQDLKERGRLHELDGGVEVKLTPKEMSRRAAARAGLSLPANAQE